MYPHIDTPVITLEQAINSDKISSLEIAQLTGKTHSHVMRDIRNMEPAWEEVHQSKFGLMQIQEKLPNGGYRLRPCYMLTKKECLFIATKYNDVARARLILRWEQLETERKQAVKAEPQKLLVTEREILLRGDEIRREKIVRAKKEADIVIVLPHIGGQYNPAPGAWSKWTVDWMSQLQPSLIVAGHPHVPLRTESVNGVFTAWSLGNLSFTPGVGYYLPNVLADYGVVLHTWFDTASMKLVKAGFNLIKNVVGEDGISRIKPVLDLWNESKNAIERDSLAIDNEALVNRLRSGAESVRVERDYIV